ncbi:D-alanyl-D-alanine carboxypeptidase/D-alanyl-D-alanine-endopeptidase [Vibrio sp. ZSDZ34]|jgi:D-alanyl-D-alanine carboxypeptidase/D-alanyl-D-alanine-endopeptidase (penicillin-binding protein 4)|uniref:D-alanyl-D-alanine carboxypeptidase/D-alanyl-D-alanine-endopeptidase n=1 Tax=Vibrio gelatinilyticus TaxID=2893468 RepID=A0A9X2AXN6_9VIBR|nr:D-alanyl-D-alanine carboxypeptidase/D-alanyl-D-alanine-endopeptidase [Vibrio gelatinilyticus]MCJ2375838.1 D-alanyl-D-alanine carboxypeptidase/D-alanyl-D-alanine-endopeptidase [Vibrio gelatinilyticus]
MTKKRLFALYFILCCTSVASFAKSELPVTSRHAIFLSPLNTSTSDLPLLENNAAQLFPPASTLKLVTALAAKMSLGDQFRYTTAVYQEKDNLIVRFSGDPSLSRDALRSMLKQAKQTAKGKINNIWLDGEAFSGYAQAVGTPWDILGVCYSAPSTAIMLDGNCVQGSLETHKDGSTRAYVPPHQPIIVTSTALSVTKEQQAEQHCDLELVTSGINQYRLTGCLTHRSSPLPLKFAVSKPSLYVASVIKDELAMLNWSINGTVAANANAAQSASKPLAMHHSQALPELLAVMLKESNNLYADSLTKTMGAKMFSQAGTFSNGVQAIKATLMEQARIDLESAVLEDGSGLSRNNRMTAQQMANVLLFIWREDQDLQLIKLLPIAGESGTLQYRSSMRLHPVKGALLAKSGTLFGTYNMAGYGLNSQGEINTLFVQFVTDYHQPVEASASPKTRPITRFERAFYEQVVQYSHSLAQTTQKAQP